MRKHRPLYTAVIVSALVHLLLLILGGQIPVSDFLDADTQPIFVDLAQLPDAPEAPPPSEATPAPASESAPEQAPPPPRTLNLNGQIVELPDPEASEQPDQADYLANKARKVQEEMKSRKFKINPDVLAPVFSDKSIEGVSDAMEITLMEEASGRPDAGPPQPPAQEVAALTPGSSRPVAARDPEQPEEPRAPQGKPPEGQGEPLPEDLPPAEQPGSQDTRAAENLAMSGQGAPQDGPGTSRQKLDLLPDRSARWAYLDRPGQVTETSTGQMQRPGRKGAPQNDYLDEKVGSATLLNSREFLYADYFNKIRRLVNFWWSQNLDNIGPGDIAAPVNRPNYRTAVQPVLDAEGRLVSVALLKSCGVPAFDRAVLDAWKAASPFPRPPDALVVSGKAELIRFDFILEIAQGESRYSAIDPRANVRFPGIAWPR